MRGLHGLLEVDSQLEYPYLTPEIRENLEETRKIHLGKLLSFQTKTCTEVSLSRIWKLCMS